MIARRPAMKRNIPHCPSTLPSACRPPYTYELSHFHHCLSSSFTVSVSHLPQYGSIPAQKLFTFSIWNHSEFCVVICFDLICPGVSCPKLDLPLGSRRNEKYGGNMGGLESWAQRGQSLLETSLYCALIEKEKMKLKAFVHQKVWNTDSKI